MTGSRPASDLAVFAKAKELCAYVMDATQRSPKSFRFTYVARMQNLALDVAWSSSFARTTCTLA